MTDAYAPPTAMMNERPSGDGPVTEEMVSALRGTKGWVLLIGILLLIAAAFTGIAGAFVAFGSATTAAGMKNMPAGLFSGIGALYIIMAALYIFLGLYLV